MQPCSICSFEATLRRLARAARVYVLMRRLLQLTGCTRQDLDRLAAEAPRLYRSRDEYHRVRDKWRHLDVPAEPLKRVQRAVAGWLADQIPVPRDIVGGIRGRSVRDHALPHVGAPCVATLDLRNFFPRSRANVLQKQLLQAGIAPDIGVLIRKLVSLRNYLPQGAPSSPRCAIIAALPMFSEMREAALALGLTITFYFDDIAVSGDRARAAIGVLIDIARRHGHSINHKKTRVLPPRVPQLVAGQTVNGALGAGEARRQAIEDAIRELAANPWATRRDLRRIEGRIQHVRSLAPGTARRLTDLVARLVQVQSLVDSPWTPRESGRRVVCTGPETCLARR